MKNWKVTIKEYDRSRPLVRRYHGEVDYNFVRDWFGCDDDDVEWFEIEEENEN